MVLAALWGFEGIDLIFFVSACLGTGLFLIKLVLMLIGGDGDVDLDMPEDIDGSIGDTDVSFHLFSIQGILSFMMMFGWVGLGISHAGGYGALPAIGGGVLAGFIMMWMVGLLYSWMWKLQGSGTIKMQNAVGQDGTIYLTIPAGGTGKARIEIQGSLKIFNAVAQDKQEIKTGEQIKVTKVISGNILVVNTV